MSKQPADWDEALVAADLVDPRNGKPSLNQLAKRANLPASTVTAMVSGRRAPKAATIQKIADALGVDVRIVSSWVGQERTERDPYAPPAEADLLTDRQRRAVDEIIRAIVAERASDRDDNQDTARMGRDAQQNGLTAGAQHTDPSGIADTNQGAPDDDAAGGADEIWSEYNRTRRKAHVRDDDA